jgi:hypothetical protein
VSGPNRILSIILLPAAEVSNKKKILTPAHLLTDNPKSSEILTLQKANKERI